MLIFDSFPTQERATEFANHIGKQFNRKAVVCQTADEARKIDAFPFELTPPIVLVERLKDNSDETAIESSVKQFDGSFAGT